MESIDLERARQQEIRAHLLKCLDRQRPSPVTEAIILRSLTQAGITIKRERLTQELAYLKGKDLVTHTGTLWRLLPLGVDLLERTIDDIPGVPHNGNLSPDLLLHRQEVRGRLLMVLYFARPHGASASLLWQALSDSDLTVSIKEMAREAVYLAGKDLIAIEGDYLSDHWKATLTPTGQDVMEYNIAAPAGIHLIEKYWEV